MDFLSRIKTPIEKELLRFEDMFVAALEHGGSLLSQALAHVSQRSGKRMRPLLLMLIAKNYGEVVDATLHAAVGLEMLHTASLVHDDVVDESDERRGQPSLNASYGNKVAVLVGDYLLSTALQHVTMTGHRAIIESVAALGRTLASGEMLQLSGADNGDLSEETYLEVVRRKTASLFETCCADGALSVGAPDDEIEAARGFGRNIGMIFQIRDDIFDYFDDTAIGKPTGKDMAEGKLTLPALYAVTTDCPEEIRTLTGKVRKGMATDDEITTLIDYAKACGGVDYARRCMLEYADEARTFIDKHVRSKEIKDALAAFLDYMMERNN